MSNREVEKLTFFCKISAVIWDLKIVHNMCLVVCAQIADCEFCWGIKLQTFAMYLHVCVQLDACFTPGQVPKQHSA